MTTVFICPTNCRDAYDPDKLPRYIVDRKDTLTNPRCFACQAIMSRIHLETASRHVIAS